MKEIWASIATIMGVAAFFQGLLRTLFPEEFRGAILGFLGQFSSYCYFDVAETDGVSSNHLYDAAQLYLSRSRSVAATATRLSLTRSVDSSSLTFGLSKNDTVFDTFRGATVRWKHTVEPRQAQAFSWRPLPEEKRSLSLRVKKRDREVILGCYLDHVIRSSEEIRRRNQDRLLHTNPQGGSSAGSLWESVPYKHPSTFETLAMDPLRKSEIMDDLHDFTGGESFYKKTGRAWKRGYLLHGPPGTGKSSLIAAMANFLRYDIYDLELAGVKTNSELRTLLMKTTSKSIIVIEDIDCSIDLALVRKKNPKKTKSGSDSMPGPEEEDVPNSITLSGLLNFTDGLWSCCGNERIFVFTTNHVETLDPALLRSGRMDMHIHMSYCTLPALKILLRNYLGSRDDDHCLEGAAEEQLAAAINEADITPADAAEILIRNRRNKESAVEELIKELSRRTQLKAQGITEQTK